jgi:hypothetical protein
LIIDLRKDASVELINHKVDGMGLNEVTKRNLNAEVKVLVPYKPPRP